MLMPDKSVVSYTVKSHRGTLWSMETIMREGIQRSKHSMKNDSAQVSFIRDGPRVRQDVFGPPVWPED